MKKIKWLIFDYIIYPLFEKQIMNESNKIWYDGCCDENNRIYEKLVEKGFEEQDIASILSW